MKRLSISLFLALIVLPLPALAQQKDSTHRVFADLQMLSRGEIRSGGLPQATEGTDDFSAFVVGRARVVMGYERPHLEVNASFQYSGIWGQAGGGSMDLYQAWIKLHTRNGFFAQLGRQALSYDDERIIGPDDWSVTGSTHDALKLGYEGHGLKFHALAAFNQNVENIETGSTYYTGGSQPYKTMQLGWLHYDFPRFPLGVSLLALNIGMQAGEPHENEHVEWQQMLGGFASFRPQKWSLEASYYRQIGRNEHGAKLDAWMASAKGRFVPSDIWSLEAGYDFLSGDDKFNIPAEGQIGLILHKVLKGFSPVYGSHHSFYGAMDFFYLKTFVHGFSPGLQNAYATVNVNPLKDLSASLSYHYFATATKLDIIGPTLGHEVELEASWSFMKNVSLSFGLSYMAGTQNMQILKRASEKGHLLWTWISLSVNPRIFQHNFPKK